MGLEGLVVGFAAGAIAFVFATIADVPSSALDEEENSSASFNNLLLLTLLSSKISERPLSGFFFSSEGLVLTF